MGWRFQATAAVETSEMVLFIGFRESNRLEYEYMVEAIYCNSTN